MCILASEQIPTVKGFAERFILIPMTEGYPPKEWADITIEDHERFQKLRSMLLKWRLITREDQLPNISFPFTGRLKELWKPLLQVTNGLTIHDILYNFVENQRKERISNKQNTLEGHIVKAVAKLYKGIEIAFVSVWDQLIEDLEGKVDEKKPNKMDTPEFGEITKQKVGYRLREILNGEKKLTRTDTGPVKVYVFDNGKLRRIIRKYGYEDFVTELPSEPSSSGVPTLIQEKEKTFFTLSDAKNDEKETGNKINGIVHSKNKISDDLASIAMENMDENAEKHVETPQKLGYIENSVTFLWHRIPPAEKCEQCGARCVEYEITNVAENQALRKCSSCFKEMRSNFADVLWREQQSTF